MLRFSFLLVGLALLAGGGDDTADVTPSPTAAAATPTPPQASGSFPRLRLERVFPNLTFARMTGLHQAPDGRWFVVEQPGRILVFENRPDAQAQVFLDITGRVDDSGNEMGLLGLALAPDFAQSGRFYVNYTASPPRRTIVSRFRVAPGGGTADPASCCASTYQTSAASPTLCPTATPSSARPAPWRKSGPTACATPGASPGT